MAVPEHTPAEWAQIARLRGHVAGVAKSGAARTRERKYIDLSAHLEALGTYREQELVTPPVNPHRRAIIADIVKTREEMAALVAQRDADLIALSAAWVAGVRPPARAARPRARAARATRSRKRQAPAAAAAPAQSPLAAIPRIPAPVAQAPPAAAAPVPPALDPQGSLPIKRRRITDVPMEERSRRVGDLFDAQMVEVDEKKVAARAAAAEALAREPRVVEIADALAELLDDIRSVPAVPDVNVGGDWERLQARLSRDEILADVLHHGLRLQALLQAQLPK